MNTCLLTKSKNLEQMIRKNTSKEESSMAKVLSTEPKSFRKNMMETFQFKESIEIELFTTIKSISKFSASKNKEFIAKSIN